MKRLKRRRYGRAIAVVAAIGLASTGLLISLAGGSQADGKEIKVISLGDADNFAVLAGAGITNSGKTKIEGDLGTFPTKTIVGESDIAKSKSKFKDDDEEAIKAAEKALRLANEEADTEGPEAAISGDLGGKTFLPGAYKSHSELGITGTVTLDGGGNPNAVFVFDTDSNLTTRPGSEIKLVNGAQSSSVFWKVGGSATLGAGSTFRGTILAMQDITANKGADVDGRLLATNGAVKLESNTITRPIHLDADASSTPVKTDLKVISLGDADDYVVLAGAGITNSGKTKIEGDLGTFPTKTIVGESDIAKSKSKFKNDDEEAIKAAEKALRHANDEADAEGPATTVSGDLDGKTFVPGVYMSPTSLAITGTVILDGRGNPNSVFVFKTGSDFTTAPGSQVQLINGAQSGNVFWVVGSSATLGTDSTFGGTILATSGITANKRAHVDGRLLATSGAVTLDTNTITKPVSLATSTTATPTPAPTVVVTPTPVPSVVTTGTPTATEAVTTAQPPESKVTATSKRKSKKGTQQIKIKPKGPVAAGDGSTAVRH